VNGVAIESARLDRLRAQMDRADVAALLTADPINIAYATGVRNMSIYSMMGAVRFLLIVADGPAILWEFAGSEHLAAASVTVDEVRTAPGVTALSGPSYLAQASSFAQEVAACCAPSTGHRLAVERMDHPVTDALRAAGLTLSDATVVLARSRMIKTEPEIVVMREAMRRVAEGVEQLRVNLVPGRTEIEVWADLHRHLIANDGEYISTRLAQSGHRTFPYFNEASSRQVENGDLFCLDTDAIGFGGYGVDFSRTYVCGDATPTSAQRSIHDLAIEQLRHNAANLGPGVAFEDFARKAWSVPDRFAPYGYSCLAHGLGMSGEYPYVPNAVDGETFDLPGEFEPGMVICVESYVGDVDSRQGAKLEDQFLVTATGVERLSTAPFCDALTC
jgi:Xaa-Pro dipeptidase